MSKRKTLSTLKFVTLRSPFHLLYLPLILSLALGCGVNHGPSEDESNLRVVSLKGVFSELLSVYGLGDSVVGVDVTSTYPPQIDALPKLGYVRNVSVEAVLSLEPNTVVVDPTEVRPEILNQLGASGIRLIQIAQQYSIEGTAALIKELADSLRIEPEVSEALQFGIDSCMQLVKPLESEVSVLFIYARGGGNTMVAGEDTQMDAMIRLAGGINAAKGFDGFKPIEAEALVASDPQVILMFNDGLEGIGGPSGLQAIPGMKHTRAGQSGTVIAMDGQYLAGFGPRVGEAVLELNRKLISLPQAGG